MRDPLTGLANRPLFERRLAEAIERTHGPETHAFAVFCLDLDRFKAVNDTLGHQAGDTVLRTVSARMRHLVRAEDTIARYGGDEFMILQTGTTQPISSHVLARRLIEAVREPMEAEGASVGVGISIGIAFGPQGGIDGDGLHRQADIALYQAKAGGRNTYRIFDAPMEETCPPPSFAASA